MRSYLQGLFGRGRRSARNPALENHVQPRLEALEDRTVPVVSVVKGGLLITGTSGNDSVLVSDYNSAYFQVVEKGVGTQYIAKSRVTTKTVTFNGYAGNDGFMSTAATLRVIAHGGTGNDTLRGGGLNDLLQGGPDKDRLYGYGGHDQLEGGVAADVLFGGSGSDHLYGGTGNDKLFGQDGTDFLQGEDNNDFLDAGSKSEAVVGGAGYDLNAYTVAVKGATFTDVYQGYSPTCAVVSSISAVARHVNLANRITYLGNMVYRIGIHARSGVYTYEDVVFDGTREAGDARFNPYQEGEFWVTLMQQAYLQSRGYDLAHLPATGLPAGDVLQAMTGNSSSWKYVGKALTEPKISDDVLWTLAVSMSLGVNVVASTKVANLNSARLVANHGYTVYGISEPFWNKAWKRWDCTVAVRNPWGYDGGAGFGNPDDGLITLSWKEVCGSMEGFWFN